ncbi:MAG: manganese efflux pump [Ruminiclostridium sp.]|jgi:putative Mn2+ efflux pump MntP|nr:manganese efflux pump [Ruminiclostridium sp.]
MGTIALLFLAVGLSMDAFAVSVCKGLAMGPVSWGRACIPGLWFGGFQGLMPLLGFLLGGRFAETITTVDHWIAFVLLAVLGVNMLRASREEAETADASLAFREMLAMAVATSIDALAVGITFAFLDVAILPAAGCIAAVTFLLSTAGVKAGSLFGGRCRAQAQALGGCILILLGGKLLLEGLGVL